MEKKSNKRRILRAVLALAAALAIAVAVYLGDYYRADAQALAALETPLPSVTVEEVSGRGLAFVPEKPAAGLAFYPGGKVQCEAYAPLMEACAARGVLCVLLRMPANLAVLDANAADGVRELYPEVERWYVGGHSLGGAMAASYAQKRPDAFEGLILLAAYPTGDLGGSGLRVLTVLGTEDGVLDWEKYERARAYLPADAEETVLDGGCHAYFGSYGAQKGDGTPRISNAEQIAETADAVAAFIR